jgi:hypothetical protein
VCTTEIVKTQRREAAAAEGARVGRMAVTGLFAAMSLVNAFMWAEDEYGANFFVQNAMDYYKHTLEGDTAYAQLDAINMAVSIMTLTGNAYIGYVVIDILD